MRTILFYRTPSGRCPTQEFLDRLSDRQAAKVAWVLRLIRDLDAVPARYFKKLAGAEDIWEVRVDAGRDTFRLLGFYEEDNVLILTHGFQKKSQELPSREIRLSEQRRREHLARRQTDG